MRRASVVTACMEDTSNAFAAMSAKELNPGARQ
uniref:Uncharacterized protein n=1 Tax=Fervidicoccus fontis TaxID=683846 RepID=A0A7J3ZLT9_9CREN